jgi:hypothetical protein
MANGKEQPNLQELLARQVYELVHAAAELYGGDAAARLEMEADLMRHVVADLRYKADVAQGLLKSGDDKPGIEEGEEELDEEAFEEAEAAAANPETEDFIELVAENMAIYDWLRTAQTGISAAPQAVKKFTSQARQLVASFEATEGRLPNDYPELENWSREHLDKGGRFLVLPMLP